MILVAAALSAAGFATALVLFLRRRQRDPRPGMYGSLNDWGGR